MMSKRPPGPWYGTYPAKTGTNAPVFLVFHAGRKEHSLAPIGRTISFQTGFRTGKCLERCYCLKTGALESSDVKSGQLNEKGGYTPGADELLETLLLGQPP